MLMATKAEVEKFFSTISPLVIEVCKERGLGDAQAHTCICQAACESAYGTSLLMVKANAYFGIKATKYWKGRVYSSKTKECYDGVTYTTITDCFRAYGSAIESIRDYFDLMDTGRYKDSLKAQTVEECITIIKKAGYATAPTYVNTILSIYNSNLATLKGYTVNSTIEPQKALKSDTEVAQEVIQGLWGNGLARRQKLIRAGYDATRIQSLVNEMLNEPLCEKYRVTAWMLNVRNGAGTSGTLVLAVLNRGDEVIIKDKKEVSGVEWGLCSKGWVSLKYLERVV